MLVLLRANVVLTFALRHADSLARRATLCAVVSLSSPRISLDVSLESLQSPWMCPWSAENLPPNSPGVLLIGFGSLERSWMYDPHGSNGLLYGARHRSQNLTQLAPTCQDAVLHLSDRCATQMLDVGASPAVSNPACSLSSDVP